MDDEWEGFEYIDPPPRQHDGLKPISIKRRMANRFGHIIWLGHVIAAALGIWLGLYLMEFIK